MTHVVWDMDGTLLDSSHVVPDAFVRTLAESGADPVTAQDVIKTYALGPPPAILEHFLGRGPTSDDLDRFYEDLKTRHVAPYPGIIDTLSALREHGPVAVFTGASRRSAEILLRSAGLTPYIDLVVAGEGPIRPKPHPDGLLEIASRFDADPAELIYAGDSPTDCAAAHAAGSVAVAAAWGHLHRSQTSADYVASFPGDLLRIRAACLPRGETSSDPGGPRYVNPRR